MTNTEHDARWYDYPPPTAPTPITCQNSPRLFFLSKRKGFILKTLNTRNVFRETEDISIELNIPVQKKHKNTNKKYNREKTQSKRYSTDFNRCSLLDPARGLKRKETKGKEMKGSADKVDQSLQISTHPDSRTGGWMLIRLEFAAAVKW